MFKNCVIENYLKISPPFPSPMKMRPGIAKKFADYGITAEVVEQLVSSQVVV